MSRVTLGCERLLTTAADKIRGRRVGLITNHSGVDARLMATADQLHRSDLCQLVALYGPEHGIRGAAQDGEKIETCADPRTGVPAYSLYGATREPDPAMLESVELMLFDLQDVGARFYTYLYTMSLAMAACAKAGIPFLVLDRPNPIGAEAIAGNLLDPDFASFVGLYPIPVRYGLTIGEIARLFNAEYGLGAELDVVWMEGWRRAAFWEDTGLPWVPPSPNMPGPETAVVYPGTCFFEGTNISEGRGTAKPFEQLGAPFIDGARLADALNEQTLPGVVFRPVFFQPAASKYAGEVCQGVQLHVLDRTVFEPLSTGFTALATVRRLYPQDFAWRVPQGGIHNFDRLAGTDQIRLALDRGVSVAELVASWTEELQTFAEIRHRYLAYT
jgi:uncharacterized protein YbbC (DUF1343 family)